jgi:hypothetical protein
MGDLSSKTEELIAEAQAELLDETVFTVDQITVLTKMIAKIRDAMEEETHRECPKYGRHYHL